MFAAMTNANATTSAARLTLTPTKVGAKLLAAIHQRHGSIKAAARAIGCDEQTVRKLIYREEPVRARLATVESFEREGYPRPLLNVA